MSTSGNPGTNPFGHAFKDEETNAEIQRQLRQITGPHSIESVAARRIGELEDQLDALRQYIESHKEDRPKGVTDCRNCDGNGYIL